jgi:hypothetical protein
MGEIHEHLVVGIGAMKRETTWHCLRRAKVVDMSVPRDKACLGIGTSRRRQAAAQHVGELVAHLDRCDPVHLTARDCGGQRRHGRVTEQQPGEDDIRVKHDRWKRRRSLPC